jgi:hypothetical protein
MIGPLRRIRTQTKALLALNIVRLHASYSLEIFIDLYLVLSTSAILKILYIPQIVIQHSFGYCLH